MRGTATLAVYGGTGMTKVVKTLSIADITVLTESGSLAFCWPGAVFIVACLISGPWALGWRVLSDQLKPPAGQGEQSAASSG
jgi:hypothetical protein